MSNKDINFIKGCTQHSENKKEQSLNLYYAYPFLNELSYTTVISYENQKLQKRSQKSPLVEDGLYVAESVFVYRNYQFLQMNLLNLLQCTSKSKSFKRLLDIVICDVNINSNQSTSAEVSCVRLLFKKKVICKVSRPFNRKLHKLLIKDSECTNVSIQVYSRDGHSTILPMPLPNYDIENSKVKIDFAISNNGSKVYTGTVACLITSSHYGKKIQEKYITDFYKTTNDPNDPQNCLSLFKPIKNIYKSHVRYFSLKDDVLMFETNLKPATQKQVYIEQSKTANMIVVEQSIYSLLATVFKNLFKAEESLHLSSSTHKNKAIGKSNLFVTVLRGTEIPVREESALVQPFVEIEWGNILHITPIAEGPAPVWHHTMHFELPKQLEGQYIKFRLFDQHPIWGAQWLGETRIALQSHKNSQGIEHWIELCPLFSPALLFGYVQSSPGQSHTKIYVSIKIENMSNQNFLESNTINTLVRRVQQCLMISYKINELKKLEEVARMVMLLPSLPIYYGPLTPFQALQIRKVDHYGRAALLAVLLDSFNLETYVILGSSQVRKWASFVLCSSVKGIYTLWDPELGKYYKLDDSRCPLIKVYRLINKFGIWENLQKSVLPYNLTYDTKLSKDWKLIEVTSLQKNDHAVKILELNITDDETKQIRKNAVDIEQTLKDKLCYWRNMLGLTTTFNRHAMSTLRNFICKIEPSAELRLHKRDLKQLYTAYHIHGFILNQRENKVDDLIEHLHGTQIYNVNNTVEFALVYHVQSYIAKISSVWLGVIVLKARNL